MRKLFLYTSMLLISLNAYAERYQLSASQLRSDGIMVGLDTPYPYPGQLLVTHNPSLCFQQGKPLPLPENKEISLIQSINNGMNFGEKFSSYFHTEPLDGHKFCYMLTGRGHVESSVWGYRPPLENIDYSKYPDGLTATRNSMDTIEVIMKPQIDEFSDLFVTPDTDSCPQPGREFTPIQEVTRYMQLSTLEMGFNGRYFNDKNAAIAIDLCYFVVLRRTKKVVATSWGFRAP